MPVVLDWSEGCRAFVQPYCDMEFDVFNHVHHQGLEEAGNFFNFTLGRGTGDGVYMSICRCCKAAVNATVEDKAADDRIRLSVLGALCAN
jgi:hypothetical protein